MDRAVFFGMVRRSNFEGRLNSGQVEGLNRILDWRDAHWPNQIDEELAYVLATAQWETAHTMTPVEEGWPLKGSSLKAYQKRLPYYPWYGRGLVQLTHEANYAKFGVRNPDDMLQWDHALQALFDGMIYGRFRGAKLADYIAPDHQDYVSARNIVNGRRKGEVLPDRAKEIAALAVDYLAALRAARTSSTKQPPSTDVKAIQERLHALRYHVGRIDGVMGEATVGALAAFQFTNALPVTGLLDVATKQVLMSDHAAASEVADARVQEDDVEGSRTIASADKVQQGSYGIGATIIAWMIAGGPKTILFGGIAALFILHVIKNARQIKEARLDDHKSGVNLGR